MDKAQPELVSALGRAGIGWRSDPTLPPDANGGFVKHRADTIAVLGGRVVFIEWKSAFQGRLPLFSEKTGWKIGQQQWSAWVRQKLATEVFLGVVFYDVNPAWPSIQKDAFIVPFPAAIAAVGAVGGEGRKSLPYHSKKGVNANEFWSDYRLQWKPAIGWLIPTDHVLFKMLCAPRPLPLAEAYRHNGKETPDDRHGDSLAIPTAVYQRHEEYP